MQDSVVYLEILQCRGNAAAWSMKVKAKKGGIMKIEDEEGKRSPKGSKYVLKGGEYFGLGPI